MSPRSHRFRPANTRLFAAEVLGVALVLGACGGGDSPGSVKIGTGNPSAAASTTTPTVQVTPTVPASPSPSPTVAKATSGSAHIVKDGDTLWDLALSWGVTVDAIIVANGLDNPDDLAIGQELKVP